MSHTTTEELATLPPTGPEILIAALGVIHAALVLVVVLQLVRGRLVVPDGVVDRLLAIVLVLWLPVVGPLLVLSYGPRAARDRARRAGSAQRS